MFPNRLLGLSVFRLRTFGVLFVRRGQIAAVVGSLRFLSSLVYVLQVWYRTSQQVLLDLLASVISNSLLWLRGDRPWPAGVDREVVVSAWLDVVRMINRGRQQKTNTIFFSTTRALRTTFPLGGANDHFCLISVPWRPPHLCSQKLLS